MPSLKAVVRAEAEASAQACASDLAIIDEALARLADRAGKAASETSHQLVARLAASGGWELLPYREPVRQSAPSHAHITADVLNRLLRVPHLKLASLDDASFARPRIALRSGLAVKTWRNLAGLNHVFVIDATGRAIFGGFVGWNNTALEDALTDIWRRYG